MDQIFTFKLQYLCVIPTLNSLWSYIEVWFPTEVGFYKVSIKGLPEKIINVILKISWTFNIVLNFILKNQ